MTVKFQAEEQSQSPAGLKLTTYRKTWRGNKEKERDSVVLCCLVCAHSTLFLLILLCARALKGFHTTAAMILAETPKFWFHRLYAVSPNYISQTISHNSSRTEFFWTNNRTISHERARSLKKRKQNKTNKKIKMVRTARVAIWMKHTGWYKMKWNKIQLNVKYSWILK